MVDRMRFELICCPVCQTGGHPKQPHSPNWLLQQSAVVRGNDGFKSYTPTTILVYATGFSPAFSKRSVCSSQMCMYFPPRILNQRTGPNSACYPSARRWLCLYALLITLYITLIFRFFAVLTTVVNIKLILEPTCIFYELSVFYRPARSYLLSFILWCPRWDLNPHALTSLRFWV